MWRIFWPEIEIEITIVLNIKHFVLETSDDFYFSTHIKEFRCCTGNSRGVDNRFALQWELFTFPANFPIGKFIFAVENSFHGSHSVMEVQFRSFLDGLIAQPALKEVLFQHISFLRQKLLRPVRKDNTDTLYIQCFDVIWYFEVEIVNSKLAQTFAAMNWGANFRVSLDDKRR